MADEEKTEAEEEQPKEESPSEAFKQGLGMLWKAARGAADEIKSQVEKGQVSDTLQQAGRELETAAQQVGKTLDDFINRASGAVEGDKTKAKQVDADVPEDGGTTEDGEKRDMRIQVDDD